LEKTPGTYRVETSSAVSIIKDSWDRVPKNTAKAFSNVKEV
jgi:hypothetical protein